MKKAYLIFLLTSCFSLLFISIFIHRNKISVSKGNINNIDRLIDDSSNMIDYIMVVIKSIVKHVNQDLNENDNEIPNELTFYMEHFDLTSLKYFLQSQENRISLINKGIDNAKQFLEKRQSF